MTRDVPLELECVTKFNLDPVVGGMVLSDVRIVLEDCLEGLETDAERIDALMDFFHIQPTCANQHPLIGGGGCILPLAHQMKHVNAEGFWWYT